MKLAGIDAPERKQAFGNKAKKYLASMTGNKRVIVHYQKYEKEQTALDRRLYSEAEMSAKANDLGLFQDKMQSHHGSLDD